MSDTAQLELLRIPRGLTRQAYAEAWAKRVRLQLLAGANSSEYADASDLSSYEAHVQKDYYARFRPYLGYSISAKNYLPRSLMVAYRLGEGPTGDASQRQWFKEALREYDLQLEVGPVSSSPDAIVDENRPLTFHIKFEDNIKGEMLRYLLSVGDPAGKLGKIYDATVTLNRLHFDMALRSMVPSSVNTRYDVPRG